MRLVVSFLKSLLNEPGRPSWSPWFIITDNDQKKLESLEMIKKEFKETFAVEAKEEPELTGEERKKEDKEAIKRIRSTKTNLKRKSKK